jgi:hypothetical protein
VNTQLFVIGFISIAGALSAQIQAPSPATLPDCAVSLGLILADPAPGTSAANATLIKQTRARQALEVEQNSSCYADILRNAPTILNGAVAERRWYQNFLNALEHRRTDKQAGSSTGTGGSTNLVSKGLTARAIAFAAEYGALTESVNQEIVTVSGSLDGFAAALARQRLFEYCPLKDTSPACLSRGGLDFLRRLSYAVSFDTSRNANTVAATSSGSPQGDAQPVTFTASRRQISAWTGRLILWNSRDTTSQEFRKQWSASLQAAAAAQLKAAGGVLLTEFRTFLGHLEFRNDTEYQNALVEAVKKLSAATTPAELNAAFNEWATNFLESVQRQPPEKLRQIIEGAVDLMYQRGMYLLAEDNFIYPLAQKPVLTVEYNNNRPVAQEPNSTFRMVFDIGIHKKWSLVANGAVSIYDNRPQVVGVKRLRSAQFGIQAQRDLGTLSLLGAAALSGTYYFQQQHSPAVLNVTPGTPLPGITLINLPDTAAKIFGEKGNIHIGQLKLVLSPGTSNARIPLSVSYSNRTELITKPFWRAQIGITYDFDGLFTK